MMMASSSSSSGVRTLERATFGPILASAPSWRRPHLGVGPILASAVVERLRHFWTVVGLIPKRLASALTLS